MTASTVADPDPGLPRSAAAAPSVGIFWGVPDRGRTVLVIDRTTLAEAETYGDCLTHPRGHHEVWEAWRRLGATALARRGLPPAIAGHEYEAFPRGRVVYMRGPALFTLYADRRLQRSNTIAEGTVDLYRVQGLLRETDDIEETGQTRLRLAIGEAVLSTTSSFNRYMAERRARLDPTYVPVWRRLRDDRDEAEPS